MSSEFVLEMNEIDKEYYGNRVLKQVNLSVKRGEIHALLGENGAGKSTLMNILFGMPVIHATGGHGGEIKIEGTPVSITSPGDAMNLGIGMVHQEFMLIPDFTITQNVKLNRETTYGNPFSTLFRSKGLEILDTPAMNRDTRKALDTLGLGIEEWTKVSGLPVGHMQFVEIAREIDKTGIKLLVFDEPTAVLAESEADKLIEAMKKLAASGIAILFITHRLDEVMQAADRVTILRDGELVDTRPVEETNVLELAELMVGRKIELVKRTDTETVAEGNEIPALELKNFAVAMPGEEVKGINLNVRKGEILGIGGLAGQGKVGIANGIMGLYPSRGEMLLNGEVLKLNDTNNALQKGIAFVSEDRRGVGLLLDSSIEQNIAITSMQIKGRFLKNFGFFTQIDQGELRKHGLNMIQELDIRCSGPQQATKQLSGGNQQKVCIARALTLSPDLLLVSEPTRGIDIGAKKLVLDLLVKLNREYGMTIVITSSELVELRSICDRIAIISAGKVEGILPPTASDREFGLMMAGEYQKLKSKEAI